MTDGAATSRSKRAILRVLWGKAAGRKVALSPGAVVRVGRGEDLELSLPHDRDLSLHHLAIDWTGEYIRVRDNASLSGTKVNGLPFVSGAVDPGSYIEAGGTMLRVFLEAHSEPLDPNLDPARLEKARRALALIRAALADEPIFGVLDAARSSRIITLLDESTDEVWSLYDGIQGAALESVAPHLVRFSHDSALLDRLVLEGWGLSWGIYFAASRPSKDVRRHLRRFLMVEPDDKKERLYFRYYDPRVLGDFLPLATPRQRSELFGDISSFLIERGDGELLRVDPFDMGSIEDEETSVPTEAHPSLGRGGGAHVPNP